MDITFYKASFTADTESTVQSVEVTDALYERLARTEFSRIGNSEKTSINVDGEMTSTRLVLLTRVIRLSVELALIDLLITVVGERVAKGDSIDPKGYRAYVEDERALLQLIQILRDETFTHLARS